MKRLAETHGRNFELIRHFLSTMFDSEMFPERGNWGTVAIGAFALAVPAGMMMLSTTPGRALREARTLSALTLLLALCGILALLAWQSLFPTRRDYLALAGMPVRPRQIFAARFACVLLLGGAITSILSLTMGRTVAACLGSIFIFSAIVGLQGILIHTLSARRFSQWSTTVQGLLLAAFVLGGLYSWFIRGWQAGMIARLPEFGAWAPPVWFFALQQKMTGTRDPFLLAMAARAVRATAGSALFAAFIYLATYRRHRKLLLEAQDMAGAPTVRTWSLLGWLARDPRRLAVLHFLAAVLGRSRVHRLVVMAYAGAGLAIMLNSILLAGKFKVLAFIALYWPLGFSFVMIAGVRHAFTMPADLPANWIFRLTEGEGRSQWMSAVERFVIACVIAPIHLINLPVAASALGWPVALRMTLLQALVSLAVFDALFYSWQQLPFTCSYTPGRDSLISSLGGWLLVLCIVVPLLAKMIAGLSELTGVFLFYFPIFIAVWLWARQRRRDGWGEAKLLYEDPAESVADLGIKDLVWIGEAETAEPVAETVPAPRPVAVSLRLYRALATAFPYEFRNAWGEEVLCVTEDAIEDIWLRYGLRGLARLLLDIAIRVPVEHLAELRHDIRYGLRMLAASRGFTAVALISLSLGICVATSAFSQMNGFILRDVPGVARPEEMVMLQPPVSYPMYERYRERHDLFANTLAFLWPVPVGVRLGTHTERIFGQLVTSSYFPTLGVHAYLGRVFDERHDQPGQTPAVVLSYRFWQAHLGGDASAVGTVLRVNGQSCEVLGVAPKDFQGASPMVYQADLWLPLAVNARVAPELADNPLERYEAKTLHVMGRLQPAVSAERAEAALDAVTRQLENDYADLDRTRGGRRVTLLPGGKMIPLAKHDLPYFTGFFTILGGMILLIASSNVANMMLARAADRRKEIAVRLALGASRARLIRQLMTECMLVAGAAGVLGFLMTTWVMRGASNIRMPSAVPLVMNLEPDGRVFLFALALTAFTGVAFGLAPALQATRTDLTPALKEGGNVRLPRFRRLSLRNLLVVSQVAGSLMLLLITGFLVLGHRRIATAAVGFETSNLYLVSLDPLRDGYSGEQVTAFFRKLADRVRGVPGVVAAALADTTPMQEMGRPASNYAADGDRRAKVIRGARKSMVGPGFFETFGIPLVQGRSFRTGDESGDAMAAVVNERVVLDCWPGENPLGRRIEIGAAGEPVFQLPSSKRGGPGRPRLSGKTRVAEVVGVVRNVRDGLDIAAKALPPMIYVPLRPQDFAQPTLYGATLVVRTAPGVDAAGVVRREIASLDDKLTPFRARTMAEQIEDLMFPVRAALWTYGCVGVFGLILASVGLAGVTVYSVTRRRREIGIRIALGARRGDVLGLVMKEGAVLVAVGTVIGLAGARAGTRLLSAFLEQVARTAGTSDSDPVLLIGAPVLLGTLAMIACYVPARGSMRVDPVVALRQE